MLAARRQLCPRTINSPAVKDKYNEAQCSLMITNKKKLGFGAMLFTMQYDKKKARRRPYMRVNGEV
jgi:hypothetical protein